MEVPESNGRLLAEVRFAPARKDEDMVLAMKSPERQATYLRPHASLIAVQNKARPFRDERGPGVWYEEAGRKEVGLKN